MVSNLQDPPPPLAPFGLFGLNWKPKNDNYSALVE